MVELRFLLLAMVLLAILYQVHLLVLKVFTAVSVAHYPASFLPIEQNVALCCLHTFNPF